MTGDAVVISILTIMAIVAGPILAVIVTRIIDEIRAAKARKLEIFRTLMRTRATPINVDHVTALNLIEVEFIQHKDVIEAWKIYLADLGQPLPSHEDVARHESIRRNRDTLLATLVWEIAKVLRVKVEQLDIFKGNYVPKGWYDDDLEQRLVRRQLLNVLSAKAPLIIRPESATQAPNPYPPRPELPK